MLNIGDQAPDFQTTDGDGNPVKLSQYRNSFVVLYFYPEDDTPNCTIEACTFRDNYSEFPKHHALVLGVSQDTAESHQKFTAHHHLQFPLLVDTERKIIDAYGAYGEKNMYGHKIMGIKRMTYLIAPDGKIAFIWKRAFAAKNPQQVLTKIIELESEYNIA